jgi:hypothetical protein
MFYELTVVQFTKMLQNLDGILEKASAYADSKKFDFEVLLQSRLAPDQFPLLRQIQIACDTAKLGVSRLTGKEAPFHDDKEKTLPEIRKRIQEVASYLESVSPKDFQGAEERKISQPRWEGKYLTGHEFLIQHAIPNFYFHLTTAYSILRNNGVDVGKKSYLGEMPFKS